MPRKELTEMVEELKTWLASETPEFRELVLRALAALPGGEDLQDMGYEPLPMGWKEAELLGKLLVTVQDASDVDYVVSSLLEEEEE